MLLNDMLTYARQPVNPLGGDENSDDP